MLPLRRHQARRSGAGATVLAAACASVFACASPAIAQAREPDPAAQQAFRDLVKATRLRAPFEVKTSIVVEAIEGEQRKAAPPVEAVLRFDPRSTPPRAECTINGFDVLAAGGKLFVRHASNEREYVEIDDGGSSYYALLIHFADLPYPQIGLVLGEEEPDEVLAQITSRTAWIVPTKVEMIDAVTEPEGAAESKGDQGAAESKGDQGAAKGADREAGGDANAVKSRPARRRLHLTSDHEELKLDIDPARNAITAMDLLITGGQMVPPGASLALRLTCEDRDLTEEEAAAAFAFDPGERRSIDSILALPRGVPSAGAGGGGGGGGPSMVGRPSPPIELPRFDDGDFDLANYRGRKVVVVDFWATWCAPCRVGLPLLDEVAREFEKRGAPVVVAAINTLEGLEGEELRRKVGAFWKDKNFTMVLALDADGHAAEQFGVRGIPATFVIGMDGTVAWEHTGLSEHYAESLTKAIEKALAPAPADGAEKP